jgi:hypothetical protein
MYAVNGSVGGTTYRYTGEKCCRSTDPGCQDRHSESKETISECSAVLSLLYLSTDEVVKSLSVCLLQFGKMRAASARTHSYTADTS